MTSRKKLGIASWDLELLPFRVRKSERREALAEHVRFGEVAGAVHDGEVAVPRGAGLQELRDDLGDLGSRRAGKMYRARSRRMKT